MIGVLIVLAPRLSIDPETASIAETLGAMLVLGGAVKGGALYGRYPDLIIGGPDDASDNGAWIPTTSIEQYGATLARWFGVAEASLVQVFPNLDAFAEQDLGFLA